MNGKILIVEDESIVALDLRQMLEEFGLEVVGLAGSAEEALALVEANQPDLALMDINIQGAFDGIQTARILNDPYGVPSVFLTSYSDDATVEKATRESPYGYLIKPFSRRELKASLQVAFHNAPVDTDLRRSNRTLTAAVDGAPEALFMISITGIVQFVNRTAEKLIGLPRRNVIGQSIFKVLDLQDRFGCCALSLHLATERPVEAFGLALRTASGKIALVDLTISTLLDDAGGLKRFVISLRDAQKRLSATTASPGLDAFDSVSMPMVQLDGNGHVLRVNEALVRETGIEAEHLLGKTLWDLNQSPDPRIAKLLVPKLQGTIAPRAIPAELRERRNSLAASQLSPWQKTEGSPPWPL